MRKKITVFSTVWNADYQYAFFCGLKQGCEERNIDLYLFNTYGESDKEYELFSRGEYHIFSLPNLSEYDGVLMATNNVGTGPWRNSLMEMIRQADIPCVGVEQQAGVEHYVGADNYTAMYGMVEYLVQVKKCRVLNYVGGPADNAENSQRKQAFYDVHKKYNIPCDPARVREYSFRWEDGVQAYEEFKSLGLADTDAVVCANDYMAIGYLKAAQNDGRNAPQDFLITGFDNIREAQQYSPQITSVDRSQEALGRECICFLDDLIEKKERRQSVHVPFSPVYSQSTGDTDGITSEADFRRELFEISISNRVRRLHLKHLRAALLGNHSVDDFISIMCHYAPLLGIQRFAMGIDAGKIVDADSQSKLFFGSYDGRSIREESVGDNSLIPKSFLADDGKPHTYLFSPCHCSGRDFGYCVVIDNFSVVREDMLSEWMLAVDDAAEDLRQSLRLQIMNQKLNELYRRDSLTGLYNRFGLKEKYDSLMEENRRNGMSTLLVFVDMDRLKKANDMFGHNIGDIALKTIADVIKRCCIGRNDFAVRFGGDEFLLFGAYRGEEETEKLLQEIERSVTKLAAERELPFALTVSTGYAEIRPDMNEDLGYYIRCADQRMYINKMNK